MKLTKMMQLIVGSSDVTRSIKAIVEEREGIPASHLTVTFSGNQLDEDRTLDSYGIHDGSVLGMYQSHVSVSVKSSSTRHTVRIHAKITDLIRTIKSRIECSLGTPEDQQILYYDGKRLENNQTLMSCGILVDSTLHLVKLCVKELEIIVKLPTEETFDVKVMVWYTVQDLKTVLESKLGASWDKYTLAYGGKPLVDEKMLAAYDIQSGSTITMLAIPDQIFIRAFNGKNIVLQVNSLETVGSIITRSRQRIKQLMNVDIPLMKLRFGHQKLEDGKSLACYGIQRDCTLDIIMYRS